MVRSLCRPAIAGIVPLSTARVGRVAVVPRRIKIRTTEDDKERFASTGATADDDRLSSTSSRTETEPLRSARAAAKFTATYIIASGFAAIAAPVSVGALLFGGSAPGGGIGATAAKASVALASSPAAAPPWLVRVLGVLAVTFGVYYLGASVGGRGERGFYESTVVGRAFLAASLVALASFGAGGGGRAAAGVAAAAVATKTPRFGLLLLAAANALGAASMALALRRDDERRREEGEAERKRVVAAVSEERDDW